MTNFVQTLGSEAMLESLEALVNASDDENTAPEESDQWVLWLMEAVLSVEQGQLLCEVRQWDEVVRLCQRALQLFEPGAGTAYRTLGWALQEQGKLTEAEQAYQRALVLQPTSAEAHARLGSVYAAQEREQEAIAAYQHAIALDPQFAGAYLKLGEVWQQLGDPLKAAQHIFHAFQLRPDLSTATDWWKLGVVLAEHQAIDESIAAYQQSLTLSPQTVETWISFVQMLRQHERLDEAIAQSKLALEHHPASPLLHTLLGNLMSQQGEWETAIALHRQAASERGWQAVSQREYRFTYDWFSHNVPNWWNHLQHCVNQPIQVLEVGSYEGMSACWWLDHLLTHPDARLTVLDIHYQTQFDQNLAATGSDQKLIKLVGNSHELLPQLEPEHYDVIYIDGCHLAEHVRLDATFSWKLLKPGGIMIFDDYAWSDPNFPEQDTQLGIDAFLASLEHQFECLHQDYQVIIRKPFSSLPANATETSVKPDISTLEEANPTLEETNVT